MKQTPEDNRSLWFVRFFGKMEMTCDQTEYNEIHYYFIVYFNWILCFQKTFFWDPTIFRRSSHTSIRHNRNQRTLGVAFEKVLPTDLGNDLYIQVIYCYHFTGHEMIAHNLEKFYSKAREASARLENNNELIWRPCRGPPPVGILWPRYCRFFFLFLDLWNY